MGVRLPAEYQEVEWIQTVRDQSYLDIPLGRITFPYFKCKLCSPTRESWSGLNFADANSSFDFVIDRKSAADPTFRFFANGQGYVMTNQSVYLPGVAEYRGADGLLVNGIFAGNFFLSDKYATELFIGRYGANIRQTRLWYCKLYDANQTILDLVPCYRKADSKPGMYDLVSGTFFVNQGTGEFLVGGDVIDSISPWLVARRRLLMKEPELYPVGTNIRSLYNAVFISEHGIDTNTGEYVENSSRQASPVYMPISPKYTYWKRGTFPNRAYLSVLAFYDKDKNYISYYGKNDYNDFVIPNIPANAKYARIAIPSGSATDVKIIRTA